jgi:hypothetical protein
MGISSGATYEKAFGKHIRNLLGATPAFYLHLPLATKLELLRGLPCSIPRKRAFSRSGSATRCLNRILPDQRWGSGSFAEKPRLHNSRSQMHRANIIPRTSVVVCPQTNRMAGVSTLFLNKRYNVPLRSEPMRREMTPCGATLDAPPVLPLEVGRDRRLRTGCPALSHSGLGKL